jgi:uncharacterized protein
MSEQENVQLVKQVLAAFQQGDSQTFLSLLSDDVDFRHPMSTDIWPWAGRRRGRAQVAESWAGLAEVSELEHFESRDFIAQGNKVVALVFERFRIKATGRTVDNEYVHAFTLSEGKVVQFCVYEDTAPIIAAIRDQGAI